MSVSPINLNKVRKAQARIAAEAKAQENRIKFGRTKAEQKADAVRAEKVIRDLDARKRDR